MTTIISWNIQNGLGIDGELSIKRIADTIKDICDPDVICLQEVSKNILLPNAEFSDQVLELSNEFSGYEAVFGAAMDVYFPDQNRRGQYGNMILSRYPIRSSFCHSLPQPTDGAIKQMPRQITEVTVEAPSGPLRIMTTHLEFHSQYQRISQSQRIMDIEAEIAEQNKLPPAFTQTGSYARFERGSKCVLCGDFNFLAHSQEYNLIVDPIDQQNSLKDAWKIINGEKPQTATCGIFDNQQWPEGPHCRDFFFVSDELTDRIENIFVDTKTQASDHQPLVIELGG